ncbi:HNH endonuclease [Shewanella chilikensis]|uniref:HNH endonuclease n=1 Tax=Shewanella chilikensis TaxID=558541 RepID=A0ABX5PLV2_9GAMM|nr:HNH endonuclease [Shewanella chilikensis]MCL1152576.1 HNH endonuclease [Shewanella chilikensis]PYE57559.1 HNH endonuclease [Shewanella chilikensis]
MPVSFEKLNIGQEYERPYLADIWGYKGFQAISRGVVTPSGTKFIILFVTKQKQEALTQYNDYLDGDLLHWEGEKKHSSDTRVINARSANDEIHLFYRDIHHTPFVYYGQIHLKEHRLLSSSPSQFVFSIRNENRSPDIFQDIETHQCEFKSLDQTEKDSIVKSRIGQGLFRDGVVELWGSCSVTGLSNHSLLRASHIKPWRDSSNQERIDPMNGLLLQPTLDHLFDLGLITFSETGKIIVSKKLSQDDINKLELKFELNFKLREIHKRTMEYMKYHQKHVFKA